MIEVDQVTVQRNHKIILNQITFGLERGRSLAVVGPNGAGKSTLLQVLGRHLLPSAGQVMLQGRDLQTYGRKELARTLAWMPQIPQVDTLFTAYETVMMARYPYLGKFQRETELDYTVGQQRMEQTGCWHLRNQKLDEISGGERQRVLLAQVLTQEPDLLLLDEPVTYLDLYHQLELLSILRKEQQLGLSWIAVLHDLNLAAQFCDQMLLLHQGNILLIDTPEHVFRSQLIDEIFGVRTTLVEADHLQVPQLIVTPRA